VNMVDRFVTRETFQMGGDVRRSREAISIRMGIRLKCESGGLKSHVTELRHLSQRLEGQLPRSSCQTDARSTRSPSSNSASKDSATPSCSRYPNSTSPTHSPSACPTPAACSAFKSPNVRTVSLQRNVSYAGSSPINHIWSQPNADHANLSTTAESSQSFVCYHIVWTIHGQASQGRLHVGRWICLLYRRFIDTN
jgi:hypothetical protein